MKMNVFKNVGLLAAFLLAGTAFAQSDSFWKPATQESTTSLTKEDRKAIPDKFTLFELRTNELKAVLATAPTRKSGLSSSTIISLPTNNGELEAFRVFEASVFSDGLKAKYPGIDSYVGQGIDDPTAIARFSVSSGGVNVMVSSPNYATIYVDPYTTDHKFYIQYSRDNVGPNPTPFACAVESSIDAQLPASPAARNADDGMLRTFRLVIGGTGEYSTYHWNDQGVPASAPDADKIAAVLVGMNTTMTRVNGVFERDVAITMEIVPNNDEMVFLNAATDGYTNNSPTALLGENQAKCDAIIGNANYDIGHVFSTQGGGVAQLRSPCVTGSKARGVTGIPTPKGDFYDIDYVAHEMGHQYGGNHPQNNNCQRSSVSIEPGSASTIMGYAGICPPNVQNNSDDYFNGVSIIEMWNNISTGNSTCAAQTATNNDPPVITSTGGFFAPRSTPFVLRGVATDPNAGNVLTYCWEQVDTTPAPMPPVATSTGGPLFRSLDPTTEPDRYMPALATVIGGSTQSTWEVVPSVQRAMSFRLTVRDNVLNGGASASALTGVTTIDGTGPFVVTSQTSATEDWEIGTNQTVTWDVAGTDLPPIDTQNVDILVSTNGGLDFDYELATGVPNNGTYDFVVPNIPNSTQARVMVLGAGNVFYNVNSTNFITSGVLGTTDSTLDNLAVWPNPSTGIVNVSFTTVSEKVSVTLYDIRGREVATTDYNASTGATFTQNVDYSAFQSGMYFMSIKNGSTTTTKKIILE